MSPVTVFELPEDHRSRPRRSTILGFTIIRLDPATIRETMLPTLTARHFDGDDGEADYRVAVTDRHDQSKVIWESEPGAAKAVRPPPDVTQTFMGPRPDQVFMIARGRDAAAIPPPPHLPGASSRSASQIVSSVLQDLRLRGRRPRRDLAGAAQPAEAGPLRARIAVVVRC